MEHDFKLSWILMKPVPNVRQLICKDNCTGGDQGALYLRRHAGTGAGKPSLDERIALS